MPEITRLMRRQAESFGFDIDEFFTENPDRDDWGFCDKCDEYYFGYDLCPCGRGY